MMRFHPTLDWFTGHVASILGQMNTDVRFFFPWDRWNLLIFDKVDYIGIDSNSYQGSAHIASTYILQGSLEYDSVLRCPILYFGASRVCRFRRQGSLNRTRTIWNNSNHQKSLPTNGNSQRGRSWPFVCRKENKNSLLVSIRRFNIIVDNSEDVNTGTSRSSHQRKC